MKEMRMTRLTKLTFEETVHLWNRGFEQYMVDISMPMDTLIGRFGFEGLSPELSVVAWDGDLPVGFVMNGIRMIGGKKVAWNGGTGVIPEYRRHGVGRQLIATSLEVYREQGVDVATLEAIASNVKAIPLYEQMGYQTLRRLAFMYLPGRYAQEAFHAPVDFQYNIQHGLPRDASEVPFYDTQASWQTQWQSTTNGGQSLILQDADGGTVGYAIFKRIYDVDNTLKSIVLYQCEAKPEHPDALEIVGTMLANVFGPSDLACTRSTVNLNLGNDVLISALRDAGFEVRTDQVYMERPMEGR